MRGWDLRGQTTGVEVRVVEMDFRVGLCDLARLVTTVNWFGNVGNGYYVRLLRFGTTITAPDRRCSETKFDVDKGEVSLNRNC